MKLFYILICTSIFFTFGCLQQQYTGTENAIENTDENEVFATSSVKFKMETNSEIIFQTYCTSLEKTTDGLFIFKQYYPTSNVITLQESYADSTMKIRQGQSVRRYDSGNLWYEGEYDNNAASGEWKYYNPSTRTIESKGNFKANIKVGTWTSYYSNEKKQNEYTFNKEGVLDGKYTVWDESGEIISELFYDNGEPLENENTDTEKSKFIIEQMPIFGEHCAYMQNQNAAKQCSEKAVLGYIYENLAYPSFARINGIEGTATVSFIVNEIGEINDIQVLNGVCDEIKMECIRIVEGFPNWSPAMRNGKPTSVEFILPIEFKLK
jgi:protein TonB